MIRPLRPTDTLGFMNFAKQACPNEAVSRDRLGRKGESNPSWSVLLREMVTWGARERLWVSEENGTIRGLVSVKPGPGSSVWEVNRIILAQCHSEHVCRDLLEGLSSMGSEHGIERVFLRLPSQSPLLKAARQAGFSQYLTECVYQHQGPLPPFDFPQVSFRTRTARDKFALFQLYNASVPQNVRSVVGMTVSEWQEVQDGAGWRRGRRELVEENDGRLSAWINVVDAGKRGFFEVIAHPANVDALEGSVGKALGLLKSKEVITCVVADFQEPMARLLEQVGFVQVAEYGVMARQLAARVKQHALAPVSA